MNNNSKIYIAGHTGLVGSAILRNLQSKGYTNFVFTPFSQYNLIEQKVVADFFEKEKPEYVFLAAAKVGGIIANNTYRAQFIYENLQIQNNIIHQSYLHNVKKLLFLGSSCIYPKNCPQPIKEDYLLTDILEYTNESYAIAKIAGLKMCESYNLQYKTNFIAAMPTNLYGPNDNFDLQKSHVLPAMIRKIHLAKCLENNDFDTIKKDFAKNPVEGCNKNSATDTIINTLARYGITTNHNSGQIVLNLWGSGQPKREFLHSDDLADAVVYLMENIDFKDIIKIKKINNDEKRNLHLNIGSGKDISIKELAELVKSIIGFKGQINWDLSKPDGTMQKLLDVSVLNNLGWQQTIPFRKGIEKVYADYQ